MFIQTQKQSKIPRWLDRWFELTALPPVPSGATFKQRERHRRNQAASSLLLLMAVMLALTLLGAVVQVFLNKNIAYVGIVLATELAIFVLCWMNRLGWTYAVAFVFMFVMMSATYALLITTPGGLTLDSIKLFDDTVGAVLIAGLLLPTPWILIMALFNIALMLGTIYGFGSPELLKILPTQFGGLLGHFLILELQVAFLAFLWSLNISSAIRRADRAEEIIKLEQALASQVQSELDEKKQLEEGIQAIIQTHAALSNGNYNVRVPITNQNVLWPIAGSLNNLLNRIQGLQREARELQQLRAALAYSAQQINIARHTGQPVRMERTGTALDALLSEVALIQHSASSEQTSTSPGNSEQLHFPPSMANQPGPLSNRNSRKLS